MITIILIIIAWYAIGVAGAFFMTNDIEGQVTLGFVPLILLLGIGGPIIAISTMIICMCNYSGVADSWNSIVIYKKKPK